MIVATAETSILERFTRHGRPTPLQTLLCTQLTPVEQQYGGFGHFSTSLIQKEIHVCSALLDTPEYAGVGCQNCWLSAQTAYMELRQLRYFVAVAEELHFGRAAARLGIEQSPLSKAIKDFEESLHVKLLTTSTRRTDLTLAGTALLGQARLILAAVHRSQTDIKEFAEGAKGDLTLGLSEGLLNVRFSSLLSQFMHETPQVRISIKEMPVEQQLSALACDTIDLGFSYSQVDTSTVVSDSLCEHELRVAMTKDHRLSAHDSLSLSDVCQEPLILSSSFRAGGAGARIDALLRSSSCPPTIVDPESSVAKLLTLVRTGRAVGLLTRAQAEWIGHPDIVFRPLSNKRNSLTSYLLHRRETPCALLARFMAKAIEGFSQKTLFPPCETQDPNPGTPST